MQKKKKGKVISSTHFKKTDIVVPRHIEKWNYLGIILILLIAIIAFIPVLKAGFINFDDPQYVSENPLITSFSNFKQIISTPVQGNLHPLTMLSLAFNYSISGTNPWSYHLLNLLFHLANTFLVYKLVRKLSKENLIISITTALLFSIHPMHVESVAWITERKDVLYAFFFLLALINYTNYVDTNSRRDYLLSILWLTFSLASKPAAVIFPFALFSIDLLRKRKLSSNLLIEKIPYLIAVAVLGFLTLHIQSAAGATIGQQFYSPFDRFFFGFYGFMIYLFKCVLPINLVPFYPFPTLNESLPLEYYLSPIVFIVVLFLSIRTFKKLKYQ